MYMHRQDALGPVEMHWPQAARPIQRAEQTEYQVKTRIGMHVMHSGRHFRILRMQPRKP